MTGKISGHRWRLTSRDSAASQSRSGVIPPQAAATTSGVTVARLLESANVTILARHLFASEELPIALGMFLDQRFIDFLHANLDEVATMHWRQFEGLVAERLPRSGLHVELGPGRNDEGVDIRAWDAEPGADDPALLLVQCKRTSAKVDRVVVKALAADVMFEGATRGLVATTSAWSPGARATVQSRGYPVREATVTPSATGCVP